MSTISSRSLQRKFKTERGPVAKKLAFGRCGNTEPVVDPKDGQLICERYLHYTKGYRYRGVGSSHAEHFAKKRKKKQSRLAFRKLFAKIGVLKNV